MYYSRDVPDMDVTPTFTAADSVTALDTSMVADLSHDGRQLTIFPAVGLLTGLAGRVLDAFLGEAAGAAVDAIFGSQVVPVDLAQLIDDALVEIDRIVGDQIAEAFSNEKKTLLNSLARQVREYVRRNNLERNRQDVQDMLRDASDLLSFFKDNGLVTNGAFQTTLALRLSLQLELLQLDELLGESDATLDAVRNNIRSQAQSGKATLERWAATFSPVENRVAVSRSRPCAEFLPSGGCRTKSTRETNLSVCMIIRSPRLQQPDRFCRSKKCTSGFILFGRRRREISACLNDAEPGFVRTVRAHAQTVGIQQFRRRNEAAVFGEGFKAFLRDLERVENLDFAAASLPVVNPSAEPSAPSADPSEA